jgi:AraC family transcriptional regulator, mar-sox-rob regulon activator
LWFILKTYEAAQKQTIAFGPPKANPVFHRAVYSGNHAGHFFAFLVHELVDLSHPSLMQAQDYMTLRTIRLKSSDEEPLDQDGFYFAFPKEGIGKCVSHHTGQRLAPGDMLVAKGATGGGLCAAGGTELVFWIFSLRLEHLIPLFDGKEISLLQRVMTGFNNPKLFPASTALAMECRRLIEGVPPQFNLVHRSQLLRIAATVLSEEFKLAHSQRMSSVSVEDRLVEVFENLKVDELLNLTVDELADKFGCTRRHLNRLFHQFFGYSVAALRMETRLLRAVCLLRDLDAKVITVAGECGFNHLGLFNTCFKRRFGESPGGWRKQIIGKENQSVIHEGNNSQCPLHSKGECPMVVTSNNRVSLAPQSGSIQKAGVQRTRELFLS